MVVVDKICIPTFLYLIRNHRSSRVMVLFNTGYLYNKIYSAALKLFGIHYEFKRMEFTSLKKNPYMEVFRNTESIVHELVNTSLIDIPDSSVKDSLLNVIQKQLFTSFWRVVSVINFVNITLQDVEHVYVASPIGKNKYNEFTRLINEVCGVYDLTLYSSRNKVDDIGYLYPQSVYTNRSYFILIYLKIIKLVMFPTIVFRQYNKSNSAIYFIHNESDQEYINANKLLDKKNSDFMSVYHDYTYDNGKQYGKLGVLGSNYFEYLECMLCGVQIFRNLIEFNPVVFYSLIGCWRDLYLLKKIYHYCNIKYVYSHYESNIAHMALASAKDDDQIASFAAVWSGGYFPSDMAVTQHKYSDRFFIWGDWHRELFEASSDQSDKYVEVGYIGDHEISAMIDPEKTVEVVQKNNYNKIIALYDTSMFHDLFFCEKALLSILDVLLELAVMSNYLIILKTKHKTNVLIKNKLKRYRKHLVINDKKGDLSPALISDLVIGISLSTPVMLAASYGKNILLYDNADIGWSRFEDMFGRDLIVNNEIELEESVKKRLKTEHCLPNNVSRYNTGIDTSVAQKKMSDYIGWYVSSSGKNKYASLRYADNKYMKKYMNHKVIKNNKSSHKLSRG